MKIFMIFTGLLMMLSLSAASNVDAQEEGTTKLANASSQSKSDWIKDPPSSVGWRVARWRMSVDEVINAFPGDVKRKNDKDSREKIKIRAKFQKKVRYDGLEYDVEFGFDTSERFSYLRFECKKAKKDSFDHVSTSFTELFGEASKKGDKTYPLGDTLRWISWDKENIKVEVSHVVSRINAFMTFRDIIVIVEHRTGDTPPNVGDSQEKETTKPANTNSPPPPPQDDEKQKKEIPQSPNQPASKEASPNRDLVAAQTDLSGIWVHQRSTPKGAVKGTLELSRASDLDKDGFTAFRGVNTYKNKKHTPETELPWLVAIKGEQVMICIEGPCSVFGCAGSLTKNGEIVARCMLLTITYAGEFRAKRLPKDGARFPSNYD